MEVTVAQMKIIEQTADANGVSYPQMMENAGMAAAKVLFAEKPMKTLAVFCGTGNNGGDGFVLARAAREAGISVRIVLVGGEPKTRDARSNWEKVQDLPMEAIEALTPEWEAWILNADSVVDAIYGTGFHGELRPNGKKACGLFNESRGFHLALDLPSGLHADTGVAAEGAAKADVTVTFHASKACHRRNPQQCGTVQVVSIGIEGVL